MEFLQVWIGRKPKKELMACIESVRSHVNSDDKYSMISTTNFLKDSSVNWIPYKDYIAELKKDEIKERMLNLVEFSKYKAITSDIIRLSYASVNERVLYADTDILLKDLPDFDDSEVYFAQHGRFTLDYCLFYNGMNTEMIKELMDRAMIRFFERGNEVKNPSQGLMRHWIFNLLNFRKMRERFQKITKVHFEHLNNGGF